MAKSAIRTLVVETYESATQVQVHLQQGYMCLQSRLTLSGSKDTECRASYKKPRSHAITLHMWATASMLDIDKRSIRERQAFYPRATIGAPQPDGKTDKWPSQSRWRLANTRQAKTVEPSDTDNTVAREGKSCRQRTRSMSAMVAASHHRL